MTSIERAESNLNKSLGNLTNLRDDEVQDALKEFKKMEFLTYLNSDVFAVTIEFLKVNDGKLTKKNFQNGAILPYIRKLVDDPEKDPQLVEKYKANILKYARHILNFRSQK